MQAALTHTYVHGAFKIILYDTQADDLWDLLDHHCLYILASLCSAVPRHSLALARLAWSLWSAVPRHNLALARLAWSLCSAVPRHSLALARLAWSLSLGIA